MYAGDPVITAPGHRSASTSAAMTTASSHAAATNAAGPAKSVPQGTSLGPVWVPQSLLFLPEIPGQVDRHR